MSDVSVDGFIEGSVVRLNPPFIGATKQEALFNDGIVMGLVVDVIEGDKPYVVITPAMRYEGRPTQELWCFPHELRSVPQELDTYIDTLLYLLERGYAPVLENYGVDLP